MGDQRGLHLGRAHPVPGYVDDIVNPASDPVISVGIAPAAVSGEVVALVVAEICLHEALVIPPASAHLPRPAVFHAKHALGLGGCDFLPRSRVENSRLDSEERQRRRARLRRDRSGNRGQQMAACFSLPPCIDYGRPSLAYILVVPSPGFRINRLADSSEHFDRRQVVRLDECGSLPHKRADCRGRGVELVDLVLLADGPKAAGIRICGNALEHQRGCAVGQRSVDNVAVAGNPAHIGSAPENIAIVIVEDVFMRHRRIEQIAAGGMHHAFGRAGGTGRVEDEQRIFGAHGLRGAVIGNIRLHLMQPAVAAGHHRHIAARAPDDKQAAIVANILQRLVRIGFQRRVAASARGLVGSDDHLRLGSIDAGRKGVGRETAEDDRMDGADAGAGKHGIGGLRNHRHVEHDAIALFNAHALQDIGEFANFAMEFLVGDALRRSGGIVRLPYDCRPAAI